MHCSSLSLALALATVVVAKSPTKLSNNKRNVRFARLNKVQLDKRQVDYTDSAHCPGGSIGDADACTFEPTTIYDTTIYRWTEYGSWHSNCDPTDTAAITSTVTDSIANTNTFTETTEISIGIESEGFSAGVSQSFAESWATTNTFSEAQQITVGPQQAGNINVGTQYILAEGSLRINYGSAQDGHYIWLQEGLQVYTPDPNASTVYSANVANCSDITEPGKGVYYYYDADYNNVISGTSETYTYEYEK